MWLSQEATPKTLHPFNLLLTEQARRLIEALKCQSDKSVPCHFGTGQADKPADAQHSHATPQTQTQNNPLLQFAEAANYRNANKRLNKALKTIAQTLRIPTFTSYAARHSFATIAAQLDIPDATIADLLGHARTVTDIYIHRDTRLADAALSRVVNAVIQ